MREQIKELCIFMVCGQTLLYFQSGKKYEKICRMILELLVLAGITGMILNLLQTMGLRGGEMQAAGGAVAGMQRSMEEALSRQLNMDGFDEAFLSAVPAEDLVKKYTEREIKSKYNYLAEPYGFTIEKVEQKEEKLQVFLKRISGENVLSQETAEKYEKADAGNPAKIAEIDKIEIARIQPGEEEGEKEEGGQGETEPEKTDREEEALKTLGRQLALVFGMEEKNLEVILID